MNTELWLVGKYTTFEPWELIGVFDSEEKAVNACVKDNYFVGPVTLNVAFPDEPVEWPGCYYPSYVK